MELSKIAVDNQPHCTERIINSQTLLASHSRVIIIHQGQRYFLRQTKLGKLILTK